MLSSCCTTIPAPRASIAPEFRSKTSTFAPHPSSAMPAQSPPIEPPTTTTRNALRLSFATDPHRVLQTCGQMFWLQDSAAQCHPVENELRTTDYSPRLR